MCQPLPAGASGLPGWGLAGGPLAAVPASRANGGDMGGPTPPCFAFPLVGEFAPAEGNRTASSGAVLVQHGGRQATHQFVRALAAVLPATPLGSLARLVWFAA